MSFGGEGESKCSDNHPSALSVEEHFGRKKEPEWREQLTLRAFVFSLVLGVVFSFIVMKLILTSGVVPTLSTSAGLLGFFFLRTWTKILEKAGFIQQPFTRQENTVIQTCVVACSNVAFSGGFGSYMLGMTKNAVDGFQQADTGINTKELALGWMTMFCFMVSFVGLFSLVPLRKIMIIEHNLTYPSGTATAHLINGFHTPEGDNLARKQVSVLFKSFGASFFWSFFQWLYSAGIECGFEYFPTFGLEAFKKKFYFDFEATFIGVGMICPYMINISLLLGSIISWGILWPYISSKKGVWYDAELPDTSLRGLAGYKIFISIAMILGDGLYHFVTVLLRSMHDMYTRKSIVVPSPDDASLEAAPMSQDDRRRTKVFLQDQILTPVAIGGYLIFATISIFSVPLIFPQLKPFHILVAYLIAPMFAYSNAYGCGLTDWSLASSYGKFAIFIFGSWVGAANGGVIAGLASCGIMMSIVSTASDLMQDFKTGYLTLTSPRSMFVSQVVGTAMGCVVSPIVFWLFESAFPVGIDGSEYPAPFAKLYRGIALLGVQGYATLPRHCITLCVCFFMAAIIINLVREVAMRRNWAVYNYMPNAMGMAIPFYVGSYFAIDMCVGCLVVLLWRRVDMQHEALFAPAVVSGMICGDGIWSMPASLLALYKVSPPMCMKFLSSADSFMLDGLLNRS